jgi:hypothetical protein
MATTGDNTSWLYGLTYASTPRPLGTSNDYSYLHVQVGPMTPAARALAADPDAGADTTIQSHPARRTRNSAQDSPGDRLDLWDVNGCAVTVDIDGQSVLGLFGPGGVLAAWSHFHVTAQRNQWT